MSRAAFLVTTAVAFVALVLSIVDAFLLSANESRRAEVLQRSNVIAAMNERRQNLPLLRDLLIAAQKEPNEKIRQLLTKYGIPFTPPPREATAQTPTTPAGAPAKPK